MRYLIASLLILALPAALFGTRYLRRRLISAPLLRQFRRILPPLSRTEEEALNAGTVWWDAELFSGDPDWHKLLSLPPAVLSDQEQAFLDGPVEQLCQMLDDWDITHNLRDLPDEVWHFLRQHRLFGMIIPERYGGLEFSAAAHSAVVMKLASRSITAAVTVMVPNSLGPAKLLLHYGTRQQKSYYLPRLARGDEIPCFALTGPEAGSDAGAIPDRGIVCYDHYRGVKTLGIRLNWEKRYITLGPVATLIGLAFRLEDPDHLIGTDPEPGITLVLVPRDTPGVSIGQRHIPLDIPFQNGPNSGRNVFVPIDQIVGGAKGAGQGWRMLMESLAEGRGISLPALATGAGKVACRYTGAYARIRRQFHQPIGYFEGVEEALARIAALSYQMDAARLLTLSAMDNGESPSILSAIIKYHLTERYRQVINDAMDIQGGSGICLGPNNLLARTYQAIPISITVEGANILTRSMIIFGQGAIRCHPQVLAELQAAHCPDQLRALDLFDRALLAHLGFLLGNLGRSLLLGLSRGRFCRTPLAGPTGFYFKQVNWMSAVFALCADVAMITLGGALKRKERLSARLGDVLSELYLVSAVLKHYQDQGAQQEDLPLLRWACDNSLYRIQEALRSLFRNLPSPALGRLLRFLTFPAGMPYSPPRDVTGHGAARSLLSPSGTRDRLTRGIYVSQDAGQRIGQLERALALADRVQPTERAIRAAVKSGLITGVRMDQLLEKALIKGVISTQEKDRLTAMERLRGQVIKVDAFSRYGRGAGSSRTGFKTERRHRTRTWMANPARRRREGER